MNVGLYNAAAALNATDRWQEMIAGNLASSAIPGYRKQDLSFSAVQAGRLAEPGVTAPGMPEHFALPKVTPATSFQPGEMRYTGGTTDVAIQGRGFFEVQLPNGTTAYTRDGEFHVSAQGQLVSKQGYLVLADGGPIQVDLDTGDPISISATGEVSQGIDVKGQITLTEFNDERLLRSINGSLFLGGDPALVATPAAESTVRQGWLEGANTTVVGEMANLIAAMRTFEANQRVITLQDERMSKAIHAAEGN